jgi:Phage late-transcription coactivator
MINTSQFISDIETLHETLSLTYMEAVVYWCEARNLDVDIVSSIVKNNRVLKAKIRTEAENLNYIKKRGAKLPV